MNLRQTWMKRVVLVLLAAAVVVPAAQAKDSTNDPTVAISPQEIAALNNSHPWVPGFQARTAAQELAAIANSHVYISRAHLQELTAAAKSHAPVASVAPASITSGAFDWADAGVGALSGFGAALVVTGTLLLVLRRKPSDQRMGAPTTV